MRRAAPGGAGGSLLKALGALAGSKSVDWANWHVFFGDERNVPHSHADSTLKVPGLRQGMQSRTFNGAVTTCDLRLLDVFLRISYSIDFHIFHISHFSF